jgi:hypothetical protein
VIRAQAIADGAPVALGAALIAFDAPLLARDAAISRFAVRASRLVSLPQLLRHFCAAASWPAGLREVREEGGKVQEVCLRKNASDLRVG